MERNKVRDLRTLFRSNDSHNKLQRTDGPLSTNTK